MCGIVASFTPIQENVDNTLTVDNTLFETLSKSISHRGKTSYGLLNGLDDLDNSFSIDIKNSIEDLDFSTKSSFKLFHSLHAIHSISPQPLYDSKKKSILAFNGEIYNFEEINTKLSISTQSDSQTLFEYLNSFSLQELIQNSNSIIQKLNGDFAFCYVRENIVFLIRDVLGVKPLLYSISKDYCTICSEKSFDIPLQEVLPQEIVIINRLDFSVSKIPQKKYELLTELQDPLSRIENEVWDLLVKSVKKRIPKDTSKKIGILFSGGIDSTILVLILKQLGVTFTCYTAKCSYEKLEEAEDFMYAQKLAKIYSLDFKYVDVDIKELEELTVKVLSIIKETNYIKVSVSLPFLASCKLAQKDSIDIMFSGLGSEEIFAGYRRHKQVEPQRINQECVNGLHILHQRDLYRDDVITMSCTQELRVPFLDKDLISYCINIPAHYKIDIKRNEEIKAEVYKKPYLNTEIMSKIILRNCAKRFLNLDDEFVYRQKKAAQYGSKFDKGILRLAKDKGLQKQEYLDNLFSKV